MAECVHVNELRSCLAEQSLDGFIVPKTDEYQNEFSAAYSERLAWASDFTGSAGLGIVMQEHAVLFVDGRYTLQAQEQVNDAVFDVEDFSDQTVQCWLKTHAQPGHRLGFDPALHTPTQVAVFDSLCAQMGVELLPVGRNPIDDCWAEQPARPASSVREQALCYAGKTSAEKCQTIALQLTEEGVEALIITMPDCICWLLNVRSTDVPHVPIVLSNAILYADGRVDWFIDANRIDFALNTSQDDRTHVRILPKEDFTSGLQQVATSADKVMFDESQTPIRVVDILKKTGTRWVSGNPVFEAKSSKNEVEIAGARAAHIRDGAALVNFLHWLDETVLETDITELSASQKLLSFRQQQELFQEASFETISGAGSHGAIVHYRANETSNRLLEKNSLYLVDSGGQYLDGTTDVTRILPIGAPTEEQKDRYTRVLQGHIALASSRFPQGTSGHQLDSFARQALWQVGLDYGHGTGHGVGSFLCVHEGPQRIAAVPNAVALRHGMIISNEPGYYKSAEYGIRIENLTVVVESAAYPGFLEFETLTLAPIEQRLIVPAMLSALERQWLDAYHQKVFATLSELVSENTRLWLKQATQPLSDQ